MKENEIKALIKLHKKYSIAKQKHMKALDMLIDELKEVTGKDIQYNEFTGDGLGVVAGDCSVHTYMSFWDAIELIKKNGTIDEDDFTYL